MVGCFCIYYFLTIIITRDAFVQHRSTHLTDLQSSCAARSKPCCTPKKKTASLQYRFAFCRGPYNASYAIVKSKCNGMPSPLVLTLSLSEVQPHSRTRMNVSMRTTTKTHRRRRDSDEAAVSSVDEEVAARTMRNHQTPEPNHQISCRSNSSQPQRARQVTHKQQTNTRSSRRSRSALQNTINIQIEIVLLRICIEKRQTA